MLGVADSDGYKQGKTWNRDGPGTPLTGRLKRRKDSAPGERERGMKKLQGRGSLELSFKRETNVRGLVVVVFFLLPYDNILRLLLEERERERKGLEKRH